MELHNISEKREETETVALIYAAVLKETFTHCMMIQTNALTRQFGEFTTVNSLTLSVSPGEVFGLLGANGAGKSTAIKMLTTLLPPTSGTATVAGFDLLRQASQVRRVIGYVPQMVSADGSLTAYENLHVFARLYAIPKGDRDERIRQSLLFMGLEDAANNQVQTFSGGMLRRLEIAISTLHRPRLLFLDEPTVGLDPIAREAVWDHIVQLQANYGTTVFLTTHYMDEADHLCGRIAILHRGVVAALGTPLELKLSVGNEQTTLDAVFAHYAAGALESDDGYREAARTRQNARRIG